MAFVKVWNKNSYDFVDPDYKGEKIIIKSGQFMEMEEEEAINFRGKYSPIEYDASGNALPKSYKMIEIEYPNGAPKAEPKNVMFTCHACGEKFTSEKELENHVDKFHLDELEDKDLRDKKKKIKPEDYKI